MTRATISADGETITVHIPLTFRKHGGQKLVVTPDGAAWAPRPHMDNAMVKALARAFRWRRMLDGGVYATIEDLARAKRLPPSYVSGILRLTLLAPGIVEAILDGRLAVEMQLDDLLKGLPLDWGGHTDGWRSMGLPIAWSDMRNRPRRFPLPRAAAKPTIPPDRMERKSAPRCAADEAIRPPSLRRYGLLVS